MKMFEKLKVGTSYKYVTEDESEYAQKVYDRYVADAQERGDKVRSLAHFLLEDVDYQQLDSFLWDKGQLVKTADGKIGVTTGWSRIGFNNVHHAVKVKTANGEGSYLPDALEKADVPPEVLDYVKSTLKDKVHDKVDEAFKGEP